MSNLIPINYDSDRQTVSGRMLHEFLEVETRYNDWFSRMVEYGFSEGIDFYSILSKTSEGGRPSTDHQLTIEMAKEIAMLQRTEKGKQARQYFIELEKRWNSPEAVMARALKMADKKILSLQSTIDDMKPKVESYNVLMDSVGCLTMREAAQILDIKGIGQNNFFKLLVLERIIYKKGDIYLPMQEYKSHFQVKQNPIRKGDRIEERSQLFLTTKGLDWLAHKLIDKGYQVNYWKGKSA
jgi:anti-repressor protein